MIHQLPADILYLILQCLPDVDTLHDFARSSKRVHGIFRTHSRSITGIVARTEAGPVHRQALRLAIVQQQRVEWDISGDSIHVSVDVPDEAAVDEIPIDWTIARSLSESVKVVRSLEVFYSRRYKDPLRASSALTDAESLRFNRGLYRFMLYWTLFHPAWQTVRDDATFELDDDEDVEDTEPMLHTQIRVQQRTFLDETTQTAEEKVEFAAARDFLEESLFWASNRFSFSSKHASISPTGEIWHGISNIVRCREKHDIIPFYKRTHTSPSHAADHEIFFHSSESLGHPLSTFNELALLDGPLYRHTRAPELLDGRRFHATCASCSREFTSGIYRDTNWDMIYGERSMTLGKLVSYHPAGIPLIQLHLMVLDPPDIYPQDFYLPDFLRGILESAVLRGETYTAQDWICLTCLIRIIKENRDV